MWHGLSAFGLKNYSQCQILQGTDGDPVCTGRADLQNAVLAQLIKNTQLLCIVWYVEKFLLEEKSQITGKHQFCSDLTSK